MIEYINTQGWCIDIVQLHLTLFGSLIPRISCMGVHVAHKSLGMRLTIWMQIPTLKCAITPILVVISQKIQINNYTE